MSQVAILLLALPACSRGAHHEGAASDTASTPTPGLVGDGSGEDPSGTESVVYATQGPLQVTVDDFRAAIAWREWLTGEPVNAHYGEGWLDDDRVLRRITSPLFDEALLRYDAERFGLVIGEVVLQAALEDYAAVAPLLGMDPDARANVLAEHGLSWDQVLGFARERLLYDAWIEHRVASVTDDDLWRAYEGNGNRVALELVDVPNVFDRDAIDNALRDRAADIRAWYDDHENYFLSPRRALSRVVRARIADGSPADARARIDALHAQARQTSVLEVVSQSHDASALTGHGARWITIDELPAAFDVPVGELGPITRDAEGYYFVENLEVRDRELRPFDETVQREIAQTLLRQSESAPAAVLVAEQVRDAMEAGTLSDEWLAEHSLLRTAVPPFRRTNAGNVPRIGEAPALVAAVFADDADVGTIVGPIRVASGVVVARISDRTRVTREDFAADRTSFEIEFTRYMRSNAWSARIAEFGQEHRRNAEVELLRRELAD